MAAGRLGGGECRTWEGVAQPVREKCPIQPVGRTVVGLMGGIYAWPRSSHGELGMKEMRRVFVYMIFFISARGEEVDSFFRLAWHSLFLMNRLQVS